MNPQRYTDAGEDLQYKAERLSEIQVGMRTIEYSDYIGAPYKTNNV